MVVPSRRFGKNHRSRFQIIFALSGKFLLMNGDNKSVHLVCILGFSGNLYRHFGTRLSVPYSRVSLSYVVVYYRRFGTKYRSHFQKSLPMIGLEDGEIDFTKRLHEIFSTRCLITRNSAVLIHFLTQARYLACIMGSSSRQTHSTDRRLSIFVLNSK